MLGQKHICHKLRRTTDIAAIRGTKRSRDSHQLAKCIVLCTFLVKYLKRLILLFILSSIIPKTDSSSFYLFHWWYPCKHFKAQNHYSNSLFSTDDDNYVKRTSKTKELKEIKSFSLVNDHFVVAKNFSKVS